MQEEQQMLDTESWGRLMDGLIAATKNGKLRWEPVDKAATTGPLTSPYSAIGFLLSPQRYVATRDSTTYQLSTESKDRAPFELSVGSFDGTKLRQIGSLRSTTSVTDPQRFQLNAKLEELFTTVNGSIESPRETVDRLLRDLGEYQ